MSPDVQFTIQIQVSEKGDIRVMIPNEMEMRNLIFAERVFQETVSKMLRDRQSRLVKPNLRSLPPPPEAS